MAVPVSWWCCVNTGENIIINKYSSELGWDQGGWEKNGLIRKIFRPIDKSDAYIRGSMKERKEQRWILSFWIHLVWWAEMIQGIWEEKWVVRGKRHAEKDGNLSLCGTSGYKCLLGRQLCSLVCRWKSWDGGIGSAVISSWMIVEVMENVRVSKGYICTEKRKTNHPFWNR